MSESESNCLDDSDSVESISRVNYHTMSFTKNFKTELTFYISAPDKLGF